MCHGAYLSWSCPNSQLTCNTDPHDLFHFNASISSHRKPHHKLCRSIIADGVFDRQDKKRTKGKNPTFKVVVSNLNGSTYSRSEEVTDTFHVQMSKPSNTLKNVNSVICTHYRLPTLKILQVSSISYTYCTLLYCTFFSTAPQCTALCIAVLYCTGLHCALYELIAYTVVF